MFKKGFTLVEVLIVVLMIGILMAIALPQYRIAVEKSKVSKYIPLLNTVYDALQRYYLINNRYPATLSSNDFDITLPTLTNATYYYFTSYGMIAVLDNSSDIRVGKIYTEGTFPKGQLLCYFNGDSIFPASVKTKICASICGHNNVVTVFYSPHKGCLAGLPDYPGV